MEATTEGELDSAFAALVARKTEALFVGSDTFFWDAREQIAGLAIELRQLTVKAHQSPAVTNPRR